MNYQVLIADDYRMIRQMFEEIIKDLIDKTAQPVLSALKDACLSPSDIDKVLLVDSLFHFGDHDKLI